MSGGSSSPTTTTTNSVPAWIDKFGQENIELAKKAAATPYQAYSGQTVAAMSPDQQAAYQSLRSNFGAYQPAYASALQAAQGVATYQPGQFNAQTLQAYENPYQQQVEQGALAAVERQRQLATNQVGQQARSVGAFGGSRQGVQEALTNAEAMRIAGETSGALRSQGFRTAAELYGQDQARAQQAAQLRLAGAGQIGAIAGAGQQALVGEAGALESAGKAQQAQQQAYLDEAYRRYAEERNYPLTQLGIRQAGLTGVPYSTTTSSTTTGGGNLGLTALGGAGLGAQIGGLIPGLGAGYGAGLGSVAAFLSDERMKTDIEKLGKDKESGLTMYAYRYKGDPKSYPKVVGPMAQEIEKKYPKQVKKVGGKLAVNLGFGPMMSNA
jgi:hypothetical protein